VQIFFIATVFTLIKGGISVRLQPLRTHRNYLTSYGPQLNQFYITLETKLCILIVILLNWYICPGKHFFIFWSISVKRHLPVISETVNAIRILNSFLLSSKCVHQNKMEQCLVYKLVTFYFNIITDFLLEINDPQDFNQTSQTFIACILLLSTSQQYLD